MEYRGINTATATQEVARCLKQQGIQIIGRYYATINTWKRLRKDEALQLGSWDLGILSIWQESANHKDYFTYSRGKQDGHAAFTVGKQLGQPPDTPIYFAVDYDATLPHRSSIIAYFRGVEESLAHQDQCSGGFRYSLGVYGSTWVLNWCRAWGKVSHFMQAYPRGWSGGENARPWPSYSARQVSSNHSLCGILVDDLVVRPTAGYWIRHIAHPRE